MSAQEPPRSRLAELFPLPADAEAGKAVLQARAEAFRVALAHGGTRAEFVRWQAAHDALAAAIAILDPPAAPAPVLKFKFKDGDFR